MSSNELQKYTVTRADISDLVYQEIGLSKKESADLVNSIFHKIEEALLEGETVKISGFGKFVTRDKPKRLGRNPKTGAAVDIAPMRVLAFKPSLKMSERVISALSEKGPQSE